MIVKDSEPPIFHIMLISFISFPCFAHSQYKSERSSLGSPQEWRERQDASTPVKEEGALSSKNSNGFGVKSLEQHMASLNLLESK